MKTLLEIIVGIVFHPIAWVLMVLNLMSRRDISDGRKVLWAIVGLLWGVGPILYCLLGDGALW